MRNKFLAAGVVVLILLSAQTAALAADKTMFIKGQNITSLGSLVNAPSSDIKFTLGVNPLSLYVPGTTTLITDFNITSGKVDDKGSGVGRNVQINCSVGDVLKATIWEGTVGYGGYYGWTTLTMNQANFDDSALTWNWDNLEIDYKAVAPYKPTITQFEEATTTLTSGGSPVSSLRVTSAAGTGTDGLREVNTSAVEWKYWDNTLTEPASTTYTGGPVLTLDSSKVTAGVTYAFRVGYKNQWGGPTWSDKYTYIVAGGGGGGGPVTITWNLQKMTGGFGINTFNVPFDTSLGAVQDSTGIVVAQGANLTIAKMIEIINKQAGGGKSVVEVFGYYDATTQKHIGLSGIVYNPTSGAITGTAIGASDANTVLNTNINPYTTGYQVSVTEAVTVTLQGFPKQ